jgi:hypothetical protein
MWLLDANMDVHLASVLEELGIACETAAHRGWKALSNGQLVAAAVASGFDCLLTRDRLFGESASRVFGVASRGTGASTDPQAAPGKHKFDPPHC